MSSQGGSSPKPQPQMKWQPKTQNSPNGNVSNYAPNAPGNKNKSNNSKNNNKNKKYIDNVKQSNSSEPQNPAQQPKTENSDQNYVLYSVPPPPDASAAFSMTQKFSPPPNMMPNFFPMMMPNISQNLNSPEKVKDQIFSLLASSATAGVDEGDKSKMGMKQPTIPFSPFGFGNPYSIPFGNGMNPSTPFPQPIQPHSSNVSNFPHMNPGYQTVQMNSTNNNSSVNTGSTSPSPPSSNGGQPGSVPVPINFPPNHFSSFYPPFPQFMNSPYGMPPNFMSYNNPQTASFFQSPFPNSSSPNDSTDIVNNNNCNDTLNHVNNNSGNNNHNMSGSPFGDHSSHQMMFHSKDESSDENNFSLKNISDPLLEIEKTFNDPSLDDDLQSVTSVVVDDSNANNSQSQREGDNSENKPPLEDAKSVPPPRHNPFHEVIDPKMKIGIPPDHSVSGIYITTHGRKVLDKYAANCEKNYAKITKGVEMLYEEIRPPYDDMVKRQELLKRIQFLVSEFWPNDNPVLHLFGSSANDFCLRGGDIDMCLTINRPDDQKIEIVEDLGRLLVAFKMENVMSLSGARVPIVKFTDPESGYSCDICINNTLALQNTQLLACYSNIDPRLKKLACVIKYWAKRRQINAPFAGTLSSYAYVLLLIHFFQRRNPPILPCLQTNIEHLPKVEVEGYDCTYHTKVFHRSFSSPKNKHSTGKLLVDFFRFYGLEFDYVNCVVSVRTGGFFTKEAKDWKKPKHVRESCFLGLEDPFEVTHNLGRVVDKRGIEIIRNELERGFIILARKGDIKRVCKEYKEDDQDCGWR